SKARMMLLSDSVGGADERRKGFSNASPVNVVASWIAIAGAPSGTCTGGVRIQADHPYIVGPMATLLIRNGIVITATDLYEGDVFVDGGKTAAIGSSLQMHADRVIDAQ